MSVSAITAPSGGEPVSAAHAVADRVRSLILDELTDGQHIGSEEELVARYGVSGPTMRQAMRVLQGEGLVTVRRGNSGGFFASTPTSQVVSRSAAALLQRQGAGLEHLLVATQIISPEVARLAATASSPEAREEFAAFVDEAWGADVDATFANAVPIALEVGGRLGLLTGNPPLALFASVLSDLIVGLQESVIGAIPDELLTRYAATLRDGHRALARALRRGDASAAAQAMRGLNEMMA